MDYQFTRDLNAQAIAEFSMGAEAMGRWFNEELGDNPIKIAELLDVIKKLQQKDITKFHLAGQEFQLFLSTDEAEVISKLLANDEHDELPEGTELYDQESIAGCGLEDFKHILESWQEFISE
jgi:uncharacterized protein YacL (UPF0231 family)